MGLSWTEKPSAFDGGFADRGAYSPSLGRMVQGGGSPGGAAIQTSDDGGNTWVSRSSPFDNGSVAAVAWSDSLELFVAVGRSTGTPLVDLVTVCSSPDGIIWTGHGDPFDWPDQANCVVWDEGQGLFVAGAFTTHSPHGKPIIYSADGVTWVGATTPWDGAFSGFSYIGGVCYSDALAKWIAVGKSFVSTPARSALESADGHTWSEVSSGPFDGSGPSGTDVIVAPDDTIVVGGNGGANAITRSSDLSTWSPVTSPLDGGTLNSLALRPGDGLMLAGGEDSGSTLAVLESVDDGASWSADSTPFDGGAISGLFFAGDIAVAGGFDALGERTVMIAAPPAPPATVQRGLCVAFGDDFLAETPSWQSLYDQHSAGLRTRAIEIDRGRQSELDKSKTGTLTSDLRDFGGILDPTNTTGPFYGTIDTTKQVAFFLTNPVTGDEKTLFRGSLEELDGVIPVESAESYIDWELSAADFLKVLANAEVIPGPAGEAEYGATDVQTRILAALDDAVTPGTWPAGLYEVFSGNVNVQDRKYAPGDMILTVAQDAADAEFPGVANLYASKEGIVTFHGRFARFTPADATYHISHWYAGDGAAVDADEDARVVPITELSFRLSDGDIINSALASPMNIADGDIAGQLSVDAGSIATRGVRSHSWPDLQTGDGNPDSNDALAETKLFSDYYAENYADSRVRITQLVFTTRRPAAKNYNAWWQFVCGVDISDLVTVKTTHPGGGGFNEDYFVEGVRYHITPLGNDFPEIRLELDLSPRAYFTTNPFS